MGTWIVSIFILALFSTLIGFIVFGVGKIIRYKESSDFGTFSGIIMAIISIAFIFFSMMNSCTSRYTTYEESIGDSMPIYFIVSILGLCVAIGYMIFESRKEKDDEKNFIRIHGVTREGLEKQKELNRQKSEEILKQKIQHLRKELNNEYGRVATTIQFSSSAKKKLDQKALIFDESSTIVITNKDKVVRKIPFNDIIDLVEDDDIRKIGKDSYHTTTKVNTGNMIKRGVVGGALLGSLGAIAGAATSSKNSITSVEKSKEIHNYSIGLILNSLDTPVYKLYFNESSASFKQALSIFKIIIERNKDSISR